MNDLRATVHIPVLRNEVVSYLKAHEGGNFLDCTLGGAGHTKALLDAHPQNTVVAIDRDRRAIERAQSWQHSYGERFTLHHADFSELPAVIGMTRFSGVLADLGLSTDQLEEERGFSFNDRVRLDMRMDSRSTLTAETIVNEYGERELFVLLREGGVGSEAKFIARAIVRARPIADARALGEIVRGAVRNTGGKTVHPATVVFQALRIAVNQEFAQIRALLDLAPRIASAGGRLAVISFHSLEDKLVTATMRRWQAGEQYPPNWRGSRNEKPVLGKLLTKKALMAGDEELGLNPSARSARMRVFEFH